MTLEQKWDLLFPVACAVAHAVERFDQCPTASAADNLDHMARQLKAAVDHISPEAK